MAFDFGALDDLFGDNEAGRNLIFQSFLDRFRPEPFGFGTPSRNRGLVTQQNRPLISNFFDQAQNEFLGATGRAAAQEQEAPTFTDFLDNDFNLGRRVRRGNVQQTGRGISRLASPARFLFNQ